MYCFCHLLFIWRSRDQLVSHGCNLNKVQTFLPTFRFLAMSLSLNCFLLGDNPDRMFIVEIPKTKNVSILKDLIEEKKAPHLDDLETELGNINLARYPKLSLPSK